MLTRRAVLTGTAGASIAVIAAAHGVATAADSNGFGYGELAGGALGAFQKRTDGFGVFLKWEGTAAEIFYKEQVGGVEVFAKTFLKGWSKVTSLASLVSIDTLDDAAASFSKIQLDGADFFLKFKDGISVRTRLTPDANGVQIDVDEFGND
jgi:hypothetical protein